MRRRNPAPRKVLKTGRFVVTRHGRLQRTRTEAETQEDFHTALTFVDQVETGDATVHDAVLDVLRDVLGANEQ
jgi:hypothetical protein